MGFLCFRTRVLLHSTQVTRFRFNVNGPPPRSIEGEQTQLIVLSEKLIFIRLIIKNTQHTKAKSGKTRKFSAGPAPSISQYFLNSFHSFRIYRAFPPTQTYQTAYRRVCMKTASPTASNLVSSVAVLHSLRIPLHSSGNSAAICLAIWSCFRPSLKRLWR